ncbi:hypothetical protein FB451DRAFT_599402 [Mycena latifolia]|nr:hypothetical protein FB451DRAFT_599402 [Mycena latifolia]
MPDWLSLPVDIWLHVLDLPICLRDLGELCLTCSQLLSITRPILYRHLSLAPESPTHPNFAVAGLFALLARDDDLARRVRELTLDYRAVSKPYYCHPGEAHIAALPLWNLTHLKRITILGNISRDAWPETIIKFIQTLHDLHLDELRLLHGRSIIISPRDVRNFILPLHPAQLAQLANPRRIEWHVGSDFDGFLVPRLAIMLAAATPTLTSLSLEARDLYSGRHELFTLRLPLLRSLALVDTQRTSTHVFFCPSEFTAFLSAHHEKLEELHLGCESNETSRAALVLSPGGLRPGFLPNLQAFRGDCRNVYMMARARMRSLATLRSLTLGSAAGSDANVMEISQMLDALEAAERLRALKNLTFERFEWRDTQRALVPALVRRFGTLCGPTLEVWSGFLPFGVCPWPLDAFAPFPRLKVIRFPQDGKLNHKDQIRTEPAQLERMHSLAGTCNELKEVVIIGRCRCVNDVCWKIDRHSVMGIALRRLD